ncbi:MAG: hypothetical protein ACOYY3_09310 [Chloroflexota bacterium]
MNNKPQVKTIMILSSLFDMLLGGCLVLAGIGWLPSPFGQPPLLKWVGAAIFLAGVGTFAFFFTRASDE